MQVTFFWYRRVRPASTKTGRDPARREGSLCTKRPRRAGQPPCAPACNTVTLRAWAAHPTIRRRTARQSETASIYICALYRIHKTQRVQVFHRDVWMHRVRPKMFRQQVSIMYLMDPTHVRVPTLGQARPDLRCVGLRTFIITSASAERHGRESGAWIRARA